MLSSKHDTKEVLMKIRNFSLDCPNFWRISFNFRELTKMFIEKALKTSSKWKVAINMNKPGTFQVGAGARKVKISIRFLFFEKSWFFGLPLVRYIFLDKVLSSITLVYAFDEIFWYMQGSIIKWLHVISSYAIPTAAISTVQTFNRLQIQRWQIQPIWLRSRLFNFFKTFENNQSKSRIKWTPSIGKS